MRTHIVRSAIPSGTCLGILVAEHSEDEESTQPLLHEWGHQLIDAVHAPPATIVNDTNTRNKVQARAVAELSLSV